MVLFGKQLLNKFQAENVQSPELAISGRNYGTELTSKYSTRGFQSFQSSATTTPDLTLLLKGKGLNSPEITTDIIADSEGPELAGSEHNY